MMRNLFHAPLAFALALSLVAPAYAGDNIQHRKVQKPKSFAEAQEMYGMGWAERPAISRIKVPGNFFLAQPVERSLPSSMASRRVRLDLRGDSPTVADLIALIEAQGVPIAVDWRSLGEPSSDKEKVGSWTVASRYQNVSNDVRNGPGSNQRYSQGSMSSGVSGVNGSSAGMADSTVVNGSGLPPIKGAAEETVDPKFAGAERGQAKPIAERQAPFRFFEGTVGQLARRLESSGNLAVWFDDGIVIGAQRRYTVAVLQNQDVVQSIVNELKRLGAQDVVGSVGAGQVTYSASPRLADEILQPYLARVQSNLSEVRLQVALVAVRMSRAAERGFDWSKLNFQFGVVPNTASGGTTGGSSGGLPGDTGGFRGTARTPTTLVGITPSTFEVAERSANIFGVHRPLSVVGAINFLSTLGESEVTQNVELASLSGAPVTLRSGRDIPYATGVQANAIGGGFGSSGGFGAIGSAQTDFLETGLTVNFEPRFDASSGIVTIDIGLNLVELESFVDVSVGNQIGSLSQPQVSRQGTNAIVRVPAGQTTIIGGVRRDAVSDDRNGPMGLFGIGSRKRSRDVFWLFAVVRPVVTSFETADLRTGEAVQNVQVREVTQEAQPMQPAAVVPTSVERAPVRPDPAAEYIKVEPVPAPAPPKPEPKAPAAVAMNTLASAVPASQPQPAVVKTEMAQVAALEPIAKPTPAPAPAPAPTVPQFVTRPMTAAERTGGTR